MPIYYYLTDPEIRNEDKKQVPTAIINSPAPFLQTRNSPLTARRKNPARSEHSLPGSVYYSLPLTIGALPLHLK